MATFTREDVAKHSTAKDLWTVIDGDVYDLTDFADMHPGGAVPLLDAAGKDGTKLFYSLHRGSVLDRPPYAKLKVGTIVNYTGPAGDAATTVPYGEAAGFWRMHSPYYNDSHHRFRAAIRTFIDAEIRPTAVDDDLKGKAPSLELNMKLGDAGILAAVVAAAPQVEMLGFTALPGGVTPAEFDEFHELIISEELKRLGCYGLADGLLGGFSIGLPPLLKFGSQELQARLCPPIIRGEKRICLAISEPYAGSDVARIKTTAVLSANKQHFVVNGVKKWITGGTYADYFTTLCNTSQGMVLLVIERDDDTVDTRAIKTSYSPAAGTSYVQFIDAVVPVANLIGKPGMGFMYAMANFNKERWGMVAGGNRLSRLMVEECFKWAGAREVFGKRLIEQPVIRQKLAAMVADVESVHSMLEDLTYQMTQMSEEEVNKVLAGPIALLKYKQTRVATMIADNACQIFGGRALTQSGMGVLVEKFNRSYKMQAILGGSEEIMADFAIRQAMKQLKPHQARL